ncbi:MAG: nucleotidyltransferase domain-containing protein [Nitrospirota bacterium]
MIPWEDLEKAISIAKKYSVGRMYLIGSALHKESEEVNDYDFAVLDVPPENFFKFYGEIMRELSKSVDIIDLSGKMTKFKNIVMEEGKVVYDRSAA